MKKIALFLLAVCTTALVACGGGNYNAVVDLYEKATKDIASITDIDALDALEAEVNQKATELATAIATSGTEVSEADAQKLQAATAKYTQALNAKVDELMD